MHFRLRCHTLQPSKNRRGMKEKGLPSRASKIEGKKKRDERK